MRTYFPFFSMRSRFGAETFAWTSCVAVALGVAELQRGQAVAVERGVDVGRVGVEVLADHQARLAMRLLALADERDVGRERRGRR